MLQVASNVGLVGTSPANDNSKEASVNKKIRRVVKSKKLLQKPRKRLIEDANQPPRALLPIHESELNLCVLMWQSTIVQALYDLSYDGRAIESRIVRAEAAAWFFEGGEDFELVCELAVLNPRKVLCMARKVVKDGEKALEGFNFRTIRKEFSDRQPTKRKRRK